jgi:hypothetical protein
MKNINMKNINMKNINMKNINMKNINMKNINMKNINMKNKNMKNINISKTITKNIKKWNSELLDKKNHTKYVNMLYLEQDFSNNKIVKNALKIKLSSYRQQDTKKKRFIKEKFITFNELLEKLVATKLNCYYCKKQCFLIYENKREKLQWTLDRKNNDIGHYGNNVVISCLECNLQKRRRNEEHFKFAKQMNIIKKY